MHDLSLVEKQRKAFRESMVLLIGVAVGTGGSVGGFAIGVFLDQPDVAVGYVLGVWIALLGTLWWMWQNPLTVGQMLVQDGDADD